jgi:hypothetical protein
VAAAAEAALLEAQALRAATTPAAAAAAVVMCCKASQMLSWLAVHVMCRFKLCQGMHCWQQSACAGITLFAQH